MQITRQELHELIWSLPMTRLAKQFDMSDVGLRKICIKHEMPLPPRGHWTLKQFGKEAPTPDLPDKDFNSIIDINEHVGANKSISEAKKLAVQLANNPPVEALRKPDQLKDRRCLDTLPSIRDFISTLEKKQNVVKFDAIKDKAPIWPPNNVFSLAYFSSGKNEIPIVATARNALRALCIADTVIERLKDRGIEVVLEQRTNYFSMNIYAVKEDQRYQFQFRETYTKVGRTPSLTRLEKTVRGYEFGSSQIEVPKNILCIHFGGSYSSKVIKDCRVKLDHQIDRIVNHIEDVLNKDIEWKKECEIREREQERRRMIRDFNNRIAKDRKRQLELAMNESSELATLLRLKNYLRMMKGIFVDLPGKQRAAGLAWIALVKSEMKHIQPIETRIMRVKRAAERPVEESKQFWYAEYLPEEKCSTSDTEDIEAEDY